MSDDDIPADMDWWRSLGAYQLETDSPDCYLTKDVGCDCHVIGVGTQNCIGWSVASTIEDATVGIGALSDESRPATRGEVRRLLAAMCIEPTTGDNP